jgi:mono/diheme cytochrome c family protein
MGWVALVLAIGCARSVELPRVTDAELMERARDDYLRLCAPCHGVDGTGGGPRVASLASPPPDLTHLAERLGSAFSHQYIVDVITGEREVPAHGRREMPVWGQRFDRVESGAEAAAALFVQRRLGALASHVESLQASPAARPPG